MNNWRAIDVYVSLIQEPLWGKTSGKAIMNGLDICRTYAALGAENNFLGAEKAIGLYLAGVVFGGPNKYSVTVFGPLLIKERIEMDSRQIAGYNCFEPDCFNFD